MKKKTKGLWIAWLLVLPVVIVRAFTTLYPIIMTFINSTYDMSLLKGNNFQFIGLGNYLRIFEDQKLLSSIGFTVKFTVVSMFFHLVLGVILALMLNMKIKGKKFLRTIVLIPWAMPMVVAGLAARWAFNDQYGLINDLIRIFIMIGLCMQIQLKEQLLQLIYGRTYLSLQFWCLPHYSFYQQIFMRQQKSMEQDRYELFSQLHCQI